MFVLQPYELVQGDYNTQLDFVVVDGQGSAVNLTGAALTLRVQDANDPTATDLTLAGSMTIDSATDGKCHYTVGNGDFASTGKFLAQIKIVPSGGGLITAPGIVILVFPSLPKSNN